MPNAAVETGVWPVRCTEKMVSRSHQKAEGSWSTTTLPGSLLLLGL